MEGEIEDKYIEQIRALKAEVEQWREVGEEVREVFRRPGSRDFALLARVKALLAKGEHDE